MIPRRITLCGFLCYKAEQIIDLDGSNLWVFAGRNGSGKSSVFDAIIFSLFGYHRSGYQNAESLINHDSDSLRVTFDFEIGGRTYRAQRSLRRGGSVERQLFVHETSPDAPTPWPAVPEASTKGGFDAWIAQHIGLNYETFTSSVMLRQGEAEKLLTRRHKERFEILEGVVGLADYKKLHQAAEDRKRRLEADVRSFRGQLADLRAVDESEVEAASRAAESAGVARASAEAEVRRLEELRRGAEQWADLEADRLDADRRLTESRALLADEDTIRRDLDRLHELEVTVPKLAGGLGLRDQIAAIHYAAGNRATEEDDLRRRSDQVTSLLGEVEGYIAGLQEEFNRDEHRSTQITDGLQRLAPPLARARLVASQREEVECLERQADEFPEELQVQLAEAEATLQDAIELRRALPPLERLAEHRNSLAEIRDRAVRQREALAAAGAEIARLDADRMSLSARLGKANIALRDARDRLTKTRAIAEEAAGRRERFEELEGSKTCDRCGQDLDTDHYDEELRRLRNEAAEAARMAAEAEGQWRDAEADTNQWEEESSELSRRSEEAAEGVRAMEAVLAEADREARYHAECCDGAYDSLPESPRLGSFPAKPNDWTATRFPTEGDLAALRDQVDRIDELTRRRDVLRSACERGRDIRSRLDQALRSIDQFGDAGDLASLAAEEDALTQEKAALDHCLRGHKVQLGLAESTRSQLHHISKYFREQAIEMRSEARHEQTRLAEIEASLKQIAEGLPEAWKSCLESASPEDVDRWNREIDDLRDRGIEARAEALMVAGTRVESALRELERIGSRQGAITTEAKRDPSGFDQPLEAAKGRFERAEADRSGRQADLVQLRGDLDRRRDLLRRKSESEGKLLVAETLARLLGRDGLQRALLREAERGILACANPILQEISGGELSLRPLGDAADPEHALELEAVERAGGRSAAIPVANLSGSQRFRVAVSLALAIGQYARGSSGTIQSVIIDEGFGCLDKFSRQEMIQELNALRGRLAKIVLVSHQEEFFDAFNDVINFERSEQTGGATVVKAIHR